MNLQTMKLVDASHKLPMPGQARMFGATENVDLHDPFWASLVKDGSIETAKAAVAPASSAPASTDTAANEAEIASEALHKLAALSH